MIIYKCPMCKKEGKLSEKWMMYSPSSGNYYCSKCLTNLIELVDFLVIR